MPFNRRSIFAVLFLTLCLAACGKNDAPVPLPAVAEEQTGTSAVAADVLFLVLGKMALYDQSATGEISLRNHHFVAEIMPKEGRQILSGTLTRASDESQVLEFRPEGTAFLAHGARVLNAEELHLLHPDGDYYFSYQTQSGRMERQSIRLQKRAAVEHMPLPASVALRQNDNDVSHSDINQEIDLTLAWEPMPGNTRVETSDLDDLIFVLVFDCFGNNVAHSGRPYQGGPYLTYRDTQYVVPASSFKPGQKYTAIVEQATADVSIFQGVPGIATYATLTFVEFSTSGATEGQRCQ